MILCLLLVAFVVSGTVVSSYVLATDKYGAVARSELDVALGYACTWEWQLTSALSPTSVATAPVISVYFLRSLVPLTLSIATVVVLYRRQRNRLLGVIKREGGIYYIGGILLYSAMTILTAVGTQNKSTAVQTAITAVDRLTQLRFIFAFYF